MTKITSNKPLFFEGAGCVERGELENCRIRTAFTNDKGVIYVIDNKPCFIGSISTYKHIK